MPQLSYLDLYEHDGQLHQQSGTLSVDALRSEHAREASDRHALMRRIRAFARTSPGDRRGDSLTQLATLQSALLRAVSSLLADSIYPKASRPVALTWNMQRRSLKVLAGHDLSENLEVWLRNSPQDETLIEVGDLDQRALEAAAHEMSIYVRQILSSFDELSVETTLTRVSSNRAPEATPAELAAVRRAELAREWLVASQVSAMLGSEAGNGSQLATQRRLAGQLLGAWVPSERAYRYPPWQFGPDGQPVEPLAEILGILREQGRMAADNRRTSGWKEIEWFLSPHTLLDGEKPADLLTTDPDKVLKIAVEQFVEEDDAGGF